MSDRTLYEHDPVISDPVISDCEYCEDCGESASVCDTTMTPRNAAHLCCCVKRTDEMGPCDAFEVGDNARCVYCDHEGACHGS